MMTLYEYFWAKNREYNINDNTLSQNFSLSKEQITLFFQMREKKSILDSFDSMDTMRANHSMSLLYLGILLNDNLNLNMNMCVSEQVFEFNYFWSIISFYHDLGYSAENNNSFIFKINQKNKINMRQHRFLLNRICDDFSLTYKFSQFFSNSISIFSKIREPLGMKYYDNLPSSMDYKRIDKIKNIEVNYKDISIEIKRSYFSEREIINYYEYRLNEFGIYDHGIVGGYIFFDSIIKCYLKAYCQRDQGTIIDFVKNCRYFCIEQIPLFAYIADCIVSHNIFFPTVDEEELYEEYSILSINKKKKISLKNNPILFLLDLIDTIDPIKYFVRTKYNYKTIEILKSFDCEFDKDTIILSLSSRSSISIKHYEEYIKNILTMDEWLNVKCYFENNKLLIVIIA